MSVLERGVVDVHVDLQVRHAILRGRVCALIVAITPAQLTISETYRRLSAPKFACGDVHGGSSLHLLVEIFMEVHPIYIIQGQVPNTF